MQEGLFALAPVPETNEFVQAEVGVATFLHSLDVGGTDAVILEPNKLFDARVDVAELLEFLDKRRTDAVIFHAAQFI